MNTLTLSRRQPPRRGPVSNFHNWGAPIEIRSSESWRFQWHEEVLKRHDLRRGPIAVAGVLMHTFDIRKGYAEIGYARLGQQAGCSRSTAASAIKKLGTAGLVRVLNRGQRLADGSLAPHRYDLIYVSRGVGDPYTGPPIYLCRTIELP